MRRRIAAAICCVVSCSAQTQPTLSLPDAEVLALKNHPQVLASDADLKTANEITTEVRSAYLPTIDGEITGAQANTDSRLGAGVLNDPRLFTHFGAGLTLSQLITDSGRTPNLVANARLKAQASSEDLRTSRYSVVAGVNSAYFEVLLSQQLIKVSQQTVDTRQKVVDQITELTKNKLRSDVDLSLVQVNLSDAQLMLLRAQNRLATAYASFGQAIGSQDAVRYQLRDPPEAPAPPKDSEPLISQAFQNRPELASADYQKQAAGKFVSAEADLKRPTVSLSAVGGALPFIKSGNANPNIPDGYESAMVNVQIPIFNGHLFTARRQAAEYQLQATQQRERAFKDQIARQVRGAWAQASTSYQAIGETEVLLKQANMALDLAKGRYDLGLASIVEFTQAQLEQTQAQVAVVNAKYEYQEAYAMLQYSLGLLR